jgi:hypothetical protein
MLNASIAKITMPPRMARRPISEKGFPVPWFVAKIDGKWDFRIVDTPKITIAYRQKLCWLCGEPLGKFLCFVIGPMCAINRVSSEPPAHRDCSEYAVRACPFLSQPRMRRNEVGLPDEYMEPGGVAVLHNPGATLIWVTASYRPMRDVAGHLFEIGEPIETLWYCEGRTATRAEILASIDKGLPHLRSAAATEPGAMDELGKKIDVAMRLLPAA